MHVINIMPRLTPAAAPGTAASTAPLAGSFQLGASARPVAQSGYQGTSPNISPSLDSQTVSSLLQQQDLNQAHGGGGGHHGGMKMLPSAEAEEAAESEEAQNLRPRRKLMKTVSRDGVNEAVEAEDGTPLPDDPEQLDADKPGDDYQAR